MSITACTISSVLCEYEDDGGRYTILIDRREEGGFAQTNLSFEGQLRPVTETHTPRKMMINSLRESRTCACFSVGKWKQMEICIHIFFGFKIIIINIYVNALEYQILMLTFTYAVMARPVHERENEIKYSKVNLSFIYIRNK